MHKGEYTHLKTPLKKGVTSEEAFKDWEESPLRKLVVEGVGNDEGYFTLTLDNSEYIFKSRLVERVAVWVE